MFQPGKMTMIRRTTGTLRVTCLLAAVALFVPAAGAADSKLDDGLSSLGFVAAGTVIEGGEYAQLLVRVIVPEHGDTIELDNCPGKGKLWNLDLRNITRGDTTTTLGVKIEGPQIPAVSYTPVIVTGKAKKFFSHRCSVMIDPFVYSSPLFHVRRYETQSFKVVPTYAASQEMAKSVREDLGKLFGALTLVAGVPAGSAAPYLATVDYGLEGLGTDDQDTVIKYFPIQSGPVPAPQKWVVPNVLLAPDGKSATMSAVLVAQLVPVKALIAAPVAPASWRATAVLATPFRASLPTPAGSGSLEQYLYSIAGREIEEFTSATPQASNVACMAVSRRIDEIGLSERDAALTLWALAKRRVDKGFAKDAEVDSLPCMGDRWDVLAAAGVKKASEEKVTAAPNKRQMKGTTDIDDALAVFFRTAAWQERRRLATQLFQYPVAYSDSAGAMMPESTSIDGRDSWAANAFDRDLPLLSRFGCYVYFEGAAAHPFADLAGRSVMVGFGELPASTDRAAGEVAVRLSFAPVSQGEDPRIDSVSVQDHVSPELRDAALHALANGRQCPSGYQPKLLFGG